MKTIGQRVRYLRQQKEISMDELARSIRIPITDGESIMYRSTTSATISNIENDKNNPSADIIIALSDFFDVSTDWILKGREFEKKCLAMDLTNTFSNKKTLHIKKSNFLSFLKPIADDSQYESYPNMNEVLNAIKLIAEKLEDHEYIIDTIMNKTKEPPKDVSKEDKFHVEFDDETPKE